MDKVMIKENSCSKQSDRQIGAEHNKLTAGGTVCKSVSKAVGEIKMNVQSLPLCKTANITANV